MNNYQNENNNWRSINPGSRRSIHDHKDCPFRDHIMGRHGLIRNKYDISKSGSTLNQDTEGIDEVDNILSKYAQPIPSANNSRKYHSSSNLNYEDLISDSNKLSRSLPTYFPSKTYCSDDSNSQDDDLSIAEDDSYYSNQSSYNENNISYNERDRLKLLSQSDYSAKHVDVNLDRNMFNRWFAIVLVLAILSVSYVGTSYSNFLNIFHHNTVVVRSKYDRFKFYNDLSNVGDKYKVQDDTILQLQTGISLISEKQDTDSFMFVYNSQDIDFDPQIFNDFVNEVASVAAKYLRNESSTVRHIVVESSSLAVRDSTELIDKYREDVTKSGVLLLQGIDTLPSKLAMALHYYCDEYNPLVKNSAIFSTLDLANCADKKSSHEHIEKCLSKKWNSVPIDNIGPLLTRVVSIVIDVTGVF